MLISIVLGMVYVGILLLIFQHRLLASTVLISALLLIPVALAIVIIQTISGVTTLTAILILLAVLLIATYILIDYPFFAALHNKAYVDEISRSNELLDTLKGFEGKTEMMKDWIGDGEPIEVPRQISIAEQAYNRLKYCLNYFFLAVKLLVIRYIWEYGHGSSFERVKLDGSNLPLIHDDLNENHDEVLRLLKNVRNTRLPVQNVFAFLAISAATTWIIVKERLLLPHINILSNSKHDYYLYIIFSDRPVIGCTLIFALFATLFFLMSMLRNFANQANVRYQVLKRYMQHFMGSDRLLIFAWIQSAFDATELVLTVNSLDYAHYSKITEGFTIKLNDINYVVISPNLSRASFYKAFARLVESKEKFLEWVDFFDDSEKDD